MQRIPTFKSLGCAAFPSIIASFPWLTRNLSLILLPSLDRRRTRKFPRAPLPSLNFIILPVTSSALLAVVHPIIANRHAALIVIFKNMLIDQPPELPVHAVSPTSIHIGMVRIAYVRFGSKADIKLVIASCAFSTTPAPLLLRSRVSKSSAQRRLNLPVLA